MIDFRYHLVSLIAVFLALAVGIVLGAGPLRDTIGDTLTGQVQDLRADRERLRGELEATELEVAERTAYLEESAPVLLDGALTGQRVALVTLPGTDGEDVETVRERLSQAGAQLVAEVAVTDAWADPETASFRQTFATQLLGYLDPAPAADAGTESIFGYALAQALTGAGADGAPSDAATTLLDLLTSTDDPLVTVTTEPSAAAHGTLLVGPRPAEEPDAAEEETAEADAEAAVLAAQVRLAEALARTTGSATVGAAASDRDLVTAVRADDAAGGSVTTVDSVGEATAGISAPLALAVALSGGHDAFGFATGAEVAVPPRVELDRPEEPTAEPADPAAEAATAEAGPTDAAGDGAGSADQAATEAGGEEADPVDEAA